MTITFVLSWFAVMFPLVFSPGPANIVFAASGANVGVRKSIPLMLGVETVFFSKSLLIGFGLGSLIEHNTNILGGLQLVGAVYLLYLAYGFLKPILKNENIAPKKLGYLDGIIIQFFNIKGWMMILLMFSLFSTGLPAIDKQTTVVFLILMLTVLNLSTHLIWISSSAYLVKTFVKGNNQKVQSVLFSVSLALVGIWFLWDNILFK